MPKLKKKIFLDFYQLVADVEEKFITDIRVEECHGQHTFEENTTVSQKVVGLKIVVGDEEIDIYDRLTQEELQILLDKWSTNTNAIYVGK